MLRSAQRFEYKDYSVPKNNPIDNASTLRQLRVAIKGQMQHARVVLIMAGV